MVKMRLSQFNISGLSKCTSGSTWTKVYGQQNLPYKANFKNFQNAFQDTKHSIFIFLVKILKLLPLGSHSH